MALVAAGAFGFLIFSHAFDGPDLYGASSFFETMPSRPSLQTASSIRSPQIVTVDHQQIECTSDGKVIGSAVMQSVEICNFFASRQTTSASITAWPLMRAASSTIRGWRFDQSAPSFVGRLSPSVSWLFLSSRNKALGDRLPVCRLANPT
jgi:hypothetical protein